MNARDIIVIGTSAGGLEVLKEIVRELPADLPATVFVVRHTAPGISSSLPRILERSGRLTASHALHGEPIRQSHIFVAPPDHHMMIEDGTISLSDGPKENRTRPAVDPLFRSAASNFGSRVIGVVLSGNLDDGTAGLLSIKDMGGLSIVQDPFSAACPGMPQSALKNVKVDLCLPINEIAPTLVALANDPVEEKGPMQMQKHLEIENRIARGEGEALREIERLGTLRSFTCPDCHSSMWQLSGSSFLRYRCRSGHAFTAETLLAAQNETIENLLSEALQAIGENSELSALIHATDASRPNEPMFRPLWTEDYRSRFIQQALRHHNGQSNSVLEASLISDEREVEKSTALPH